MGWSSRKKKEGIFRTVYFVRRKKFLTFCFIQNINTFAYQKTLLHTLLLLVFKIVEILQCILNLLKESTFVFSYLVHCVNEALVKNEFPDLLKLLNIVPLHKNKLQGC